MRPTRFKIELFGYETFDGFTNEEIWNGWACPYFTFKQAQKVLKDYNELRQISGQNKLAQYDSADDAFIFPTDDEDELEVFVAIKENDEKFYRVGAFGWIWEETT